MHVEDSSKDKAAPVVSCAGLGGAAQLSSQRRSSCSLSTKLSLLHLCTSARAVVRQRERKCFDCAGVDTAGEREPTERAEMNRSPAFQMK